MLKSHFGTIVSALGTSPFLPIYLAANKLIKHALDVTTYRVIIFFMFLLCFFMIVNLCAYNRADAIQVNITGIFVHVSETFINLVDKMECCATHLEGQ